jgi:hypothetical protein
MKFPRTTRVSAGAPTDAHERLAEARSEERRLAERMDDAAEASPAEARAATELSAAGANVAAREAWANWAERDQ